jgi:hypothetical protein
LLSAFSFELSALSFQLVAGFQLQRSLVTVVTSDKRFYLIRFTFLPTSGRTRLRLSTGCCAQVTRRATKAFKELIPAAMLL